jgi:glucose-6-phosphate isomerase
MALMLDISASGIRDFSPLSGKLREISRMDPPSFATHRPDFGGISRVLSKYRKLKKLVVAGNGGSINSFLALAGSLSDGKKDYYPVSTSEPDFLGDVQSMCPRDDTLVMPVSKSGTNVTPIETMLWFMNLGYPTLPVTDPSGALSEIAKAKDIEYLAHPDIGGRFAGVTSCALAPASFLGIPVERVSRGALSMYRNANPGVGIRDNPALQLSSALCLLSRKGRSIAFAPVYSSRLSGFIPLITQLIHESACKEGKGITLISGMGPEIQHHSTQRFFGGRRDMAGIFIKTRRFGDERTPVSIPKKLQAIPIREGTLRNLDGVRYSDSVRYDFEGVRRQASRDRIPHAILSLDRVTPESAGEFMAFWQYVAVYTSVMLGVDPFSQPEVEYAKKVSFDLRRKG